MEDSYPQFSTTTPLSPTGSLLRGWRPSLAALFHQFRGSSDRDYLLKEDFSEVFLEPSDLDKAFSELDKDGDGRITLEEFMAGFATFLRQSQSRRPTMTDTALDPGGFRRKGSVRRSVRKRPVPEVFFETSDTTVDDDKKKPTVAFKSSLKPLGTRTQENIEQLWCSLNDNNPELIGDFEDFICEMSEEVGSAQKALRKQREVNNKEALQLDEEMERLHNHTKSQLKHEAAVLREKAQSNQYRLEEQLQEKEEELTEIKTKLETLESQIVASKHQQTELEDKCASAFREKDELLTRLERSESLLSESQKMITSLKRQASENERRQKSVLEEQEAAIAQIESNYSKDITELKEKLSSMAYQQDELQQNQRQLKNRPDLLSAAHQDPIGRTSPCSLLDEIVETEGTSSPALKDTMIHLSPSNPLPTFLLPSPEQSEDPVPPNYLHLREMEHLDLASLPSTKPSPTEPDPLQSNGVRMRTNGSVRRARPVSLYASYPQNPENMDLNWPPGNWVVPPQEWLAAIAAATITTARQETAAMSPQVERFASQEANGTPSEVKRLESRHEKYSNPELCKPLDFVGGLVVQPDTTFKVLIVGNPHVGKTCFLMRLCTNSFTSRYASTIGVDLYNRVLKVDEKIVMLQLWDTAGQERFQSVTRSYYRGAQGVVLMYDITREESFIAVRTWVNSIQENMGEFPSVLLLVGNKVDLDELGKREVLTETGETFAKIYGAHFIETSAKSGYNVANTCLTLVNNLILESKSISADTVGVVDVTDKQRRCFC